MCYKYYEENCLEVVNLFVIFMFVLFLLLCESALNYTEHNLTMTVSIGLSFRMRHEREICSLCERFLLILRRNDNNNGFCILFIMSNLRHLSLVYLRFSSNRHINFCSSNVEESCSNRH